MRRAILLLAAAPLFADTGRPPARIDETLWKQGDWVAATNDKWADCELEGSVLAARIAGRGESALVRRTRWPLQIPCRVVFTVRWTEKSFESAYPSVHVLFDPPALDDPWWKAPIADAPGAGFWSGDRWGYLFHFPDLSEGWAQHGMSTRIESAPLRHAYRPPKGEWIRIEIRLEAERIAVVVAGREVATCKTPLGKYRTFTVAFGDQTSTRVELDSVRVLRGR